MSAVRVDEAEVPLLDALERTAAVLDDCRAWMASREPEDEEEAGRHRQRRTMLARQASETVSDAYTTSIRHIRPDRASPRPQGRG